ncbi:MAG: TIGR03986 family type III CRISPR-associated RAMP protein, partial [Halothiobacillaceae bacterium]
YTEYQKAQTVPIRKDILDAYLQTQKILADDRIGHLSPGHPLAAKPEKNSAVNAIRNNAALQPKQLIYVEIEHGLTKTGKPGIRIVSLGHHFHYRWAYTSSVRRKGRLLDGKGELRAELALHPLEKHGDDGAPQQLTGARLLFGYALDGKEEDYQPLAKGSFKRLAGRIAFNTAIEDASGKTTEQRFVDGGKPIQLKVLGMPRPSAVEFYVRQTALPKALTTYGDLPSDRGGDLAGRKFYRHQPDTRSNRLYAADTGGNPAQDQEAARGTTVRYLSAPGSRFRCTLRFDSLRPWELGALLAALDPALIERAFGLHQHPHGYAHKLGYGKPLGLGSVRLMVDAARWQENDSWVWQQARRDETRWENLVSSSLAALKAKLENHMGKEGARKHLEAWLATRRWNSKGRAAYPTADKNGNKTIFNFHTDLRRCHAEARRGNVNVNFRDLQTLLQSEKPRTP